MLRGPCPWLTVRSSPHCPASREIVPGSGTVHGSRSGVERHSGISVSIWAYKYSIKVIIIHGFCTFKRENLEFFLMIRVSANGL